MFLLLLPLDFKEFVTVRLAFFLCVAYVISGVAVTSALYIRPVNLGFDLKEIAIVMVQGFS